MRIPAQQKGGKDGRGGGPGGWYARYLCGWACICGTDLFLTSTAACCLCFGAVGEVHHANKQILILSSAGKPIFAR